MKLRPATIWGIIILGLAAALTGPLMLRHLPTEPRTHSVKLVAQKYGYLPQRLVVNKGDTIVFKPTSKDVTHGFYLDGYDLEFQIKQQGIALLKYSWEEDDGTIQTDWDKVSEVEWVADRPGKFIYRCTRTCGNLHPFMTGELIVRPNTPYHLALSLSIWLAGGMLLLFRFQPGFFRVRHRTVDLLKRLPFLKWLVKRRSFQFLLILPGVILFYLFLLSSFWGSPVGNRNIAIIFVWILWWFSLKAIFVPLGARLWCLICPLPAPAEWLSRKTLTAVRYVENPVRKLYHRFTGLQKDWPVMLRNMWIQNFIFLGMISFGIILITRPAATAVLFFAILGMTLILMLFFRQRVFCQYLCPVGGFLGNYAMASMTAVRVVDPEICRKHQNKACLCGSPDGWACPWNQYAGTMNRNNYCGFCTECLKSCPKDNVSIFLRPFGSDRMLGGYDEMFNVLIMLVVAMGFSVTMLGPWGGIKAAANVTESREIGPFLIYVGVLWSLALVVFPGVFALTAAGARAMAGDRTTRRQMMLRLAYIFVPIGIFAWIAFSLPSIMVNFNYLLVVLSDPLGLGWDLFGTANQPFQPILAEWIPSLQGVILLAGLYFGLSRGFQTLSDAIPQAVSLSRAMVLPSVLALLVTQMFLKLYLG